MKPNLILPIRLGEILYGGTYKNYTQGFSGAEVYKITLYNKRNLYLKIYPHSCNLPLKREMEVMSWLSDKLPVPEVICYDCFENHEYLLTSEVIGKPASELIKYDPSATVKLLADGLNMLHSLDISSCPFDQTIKKKLIASKYNIDNNLVNENDFDEEYSGMKAKDIYNILMDTHPLNEKLVFTHGDYCLPNIIINDNRISGFIDLSAAGISDEYQDISLVVKSLHYNIGKETNKYIDLLFEHLCINNINKEKLKYYSMLDELF